MEERQQTLVVIREVSEYNDLYRRVHEETHQRRRLDPDYEKHPNKQTWKEAENR